ncbi:MAG TPA: lytic transglycosylase domain-containing protein [Flavitalea sp.]|nr:lytic transglycosylase domain-containing protein [Flavitalea sp.]
MKVTKPLLHFSAGTVAGVLIISQLAFNNDTRKNQLDNNPPQWHIPQTPESMSFAGEKVPLERWDIEERFDREFLFIYYQTSNIIFVKKLANRYFPLIEERLKANGVPDDFKYLCVAESNLQHAISRSGAVGFWQFMSYTAPGYSLRINKDIDERYHVEKATDAACKYLKAAYSKFGTWTAAAASYNCGQGGYQKHSTNQQTSNYYDLQLPEETNRYIFRILSFKYLLENPEKMGFTLSDEDLYQSFSVQSITIKESIPDLAKFAIENGTTYKMIKQLNPWLRSTSLAVVPGNSYTILLPTDN